MSKKTFLAIACCLLILHHGTISTIVTRQSYTYTYHCYVLWTNTSSRKKVFISPHFKTCKHNMNSRVTKQTALRVDNHQQTYARTNTLCRLTHVVNQPIYTITTCWYVPITLGPCFWLFWFSGSKPGICMR